jgi:hypothetical protein
MNTVKWIGIIIIWIVVAVVAGNALGWWTIGG